MSKVSVWIDDADRALDDRGRRICIRIRGSSTVAGQIPPDEVLEIPVAVVRGFLQSMQNTHFEGTARIEKLSTERMAEAIEEYSAFATSPEQLARMFNDQIGAVLCQLRNHGAFRAGLSIYYGELKISP